MSLGPFRTMQDDSERLRESRDKWRQCAEKALQSVDEGIAIATQLRADNAKLRAALERIANNCPATAELTLAHEMADDAIAALGPKWLKAKAQREAARK